MLTVTRAIDFPHEMDPAAMPGYPYEAHLNCSFQSLVRIGDDEGDTFEPAALERGQKFGPELTVFTVAGIKSENLSIARGRHSGRDHDRPGDNVEYPTT